MLKLSAHLRKIAYDVGVVDKHLALCIVHGSDAYDITAYNYDVVKSSIEKFEKEKLQNPDCIDDFFVSLKSSVLGTITMEPATSGCGSNYEISSSAAIGGNGPLLYDVALSIAKNEGVGVIPDRDGVSGKAQGVWDFYKYRRNDIITHPLSGKCPESKSSLRNDVGDDILEYEYYIKSPIKYEEAVSRHTSLVTMVKKAGIPADSYINTLSIQSAVFFRTKYRST